MNVCHNNAQIKERASVPQTQVPQIIQAGRFHNAQEARIVDMPLRIQITIPHLYRIIESEIGHGMIIL
jgi:5'-deoxynucleotidase YfbR-like HD superfamily hydrolase